MSIDTLRSGSPSESDSVSVSYSSLETSSGISCKTGITMPMVDMPVKADIATEETPWGDPQLPEPPLTGTVPPTTKSDDFLFA